MKPKTTIVLVILLTLVGLGVWMSKAIRRHLDTGPGEQAGRVFPLATGEAKKLILEHRDGTKLVFVHTNNRWNMIEPRLLPADAGAVRSVVNMMTNLKYRRSFAKFSANGSARPSESVMGLDRPRWVVSVTDSADRTWTLQVGAAAPSVGGEDETYVRADPAGPVYVVAKNLSDLLRRDVKEYRDMTVFSDVKPSRIVAVHVEGRENYTLRKHADGWKVAQPFHARADTQAVRNLLASVTTNLRVRRFLSEAAVSLRPYGLDRPQLVVTLTTEEPVAPTASRPMDAPNIHTLLLGNHRGKSVCAMIQGRPEVFTLPETAMETLQPELKTLLPKTVLSFDPADVDRVKIQRKEGTLLLRRDDDAWTMTKPFSGPVETRPVDELLHALGNLNVQSWIPPLPGQSSSPLRPIATFTLHMRNGTRETLQVGPPPRDGETVFCKRKDTSALAAASVQNSETLYWPARKFFSRALLPIAPDAEVLGMTIDRPDGAYVLAKCENVWTLAAPVTARADAEAVAAILRELQGLQAKKIIALGRTTPKAYTEAKDRITILLTTRGPGGEPVENWQLCIVKLENKVFAWREDQSVVAVGTCSVELYDTLAQSLEKTK